MNAQFDLPPDEPWTAPPELSAPTPRRLKWTGAAVVSVVLGAFYLCLLAAIALATFGWARNADLLRRDGAEADAVVTRAWSESSTPMVAYDFSAGGRTVHGEHAIATRRASGSTAGSHIRVQYVRSEPDVNRPVGSSDPAPPYSLSFLFIALWILFVPMVVLPIRKERRLLGYGQPVAAVITNNPQGRIPKYGYVLKYEFQLPDGSTVTGRTQRDARWRNGALVCVVYDPARPRRNDMYPTRLWRLRQ